VYQRFLLKARWIIAPPTHICFVSRIVRLESPGDQSRGRGRGIAAARDVDLSATDVKLHRTASGVSPKLPKMTKNDGGSGATYLRWRARVVDSELLDAEEVFAIRDALGDVARVRNLDKFVSPSLWNL